ncbi:MAG: glycosyl hydrolase family 18 protein, partial [Calditerricola sp.]|nr:glycosyl hydrolase family 18 protein [Calditerricola sp.]
GMPLYGYDWTLPFVRGGPFAPSISPQEAIQRAARYGATIQYDSQAQAPFFRYIDAQGRQHEVWFEDARSAQAKFDLVKAYRLRGISYWVLGNAFPQNWLLLLDNFQVRKR